MLNYFENKKILVTGSSGYIAYNLVHKLRDVNCQIVCLSRSQTSSNAGNSPAKIVNETGDLTKAETWERILEDVNIVFHLAAQTSALVSNENPQADWRANVLPMMEMLEVCRRREWKPSVLFSSTVTVTGIPKHLPVDESTEPCPITIYDLHKFMAEEYLKYYSRQSIVNGTILRLPNVYGPGPRSRSHDRGILNLMASKAVSGDALSVYGSGRYLRDYIHVQDVVSAFLRAAMQIDLLKSQHFIIGRGEGHSMASAVELISESVSSKTGRKVKINQEQTTDKLSAIDRRNFIANSERFSALTGWRPEIPLREGIDEMIEVIT